MLILFSEEYSEHDDLFNTCDELNDFLLNDLTDDSEASPPPPAPRHQRHLYK